MIDRDYDDLRLEQSLAPMASPYEIKRPAPLVYVDQPDPRAGIMQQASRDLCVHHASGEGDDDRAARRSAIRRRLAELKVREQRADELRQAIAKINAECDTAVLSHAEITGALQIELASAETRVVDQILQAGPDDRLQAKAASIRAKIDEANAVLERTTSAANQARQLLERELAKPELSTAAASVLEGELFTLGDRELLDEHTVAMSTIRWCEHRRAAASGKLNELSDWLAQAKRRRDDREAAKIEQRVDAWRRELAKAAELTAAAQAEAEALRQRILSE